MQRGEEEGQSINIQSAAFVRNAEAIGKDEMAASLKTQRV